MTFDRIVTHGDFDGVASAALCAYYFNIQAITFTSPQSIVDGKIRCTTRDVICDLPCPTAYGAWFDHHPGNLEDLKLRGIDPRDDTIQYANEKSCARVIYNYFASIQSHLPDRFRALVEEADRLDSFDYQSVADWQMARPGRIVDMAMKNKWRPRMIRNAFFREMVFLLRDEPIEGVARVGAIQRAYNDQLAHDLKMRMVIQRHIRSVPLRHGKTLLVIDLLSFKRMVNVDKNLAYIDFPGGDLVVLLKPIFDEGIKTTSFSISASHAFIRTGRVALNRDGNGGLGEFMRRHNIGDGHAGAAAGLVKTKSKAEMYQQAQHYLDALVVYCNQNVF